MKNVFAVLVVFLGAALSTTFVPPRIAADLARFRNDLGARWSARNIDESDNFTPADDPSDDASAAQPVDLNSDDASAAPAAAPSRTYKPSADALAATRSARRIRYDGAGAWNGGRGCARTMTPGAAALKAKLKGMFPQIINSIGGFNCRQNTANKAKMSEHGSGRALDLMIRTVRGMADPRGNQVADYLMKNAATFGVQYFIWNRMSYSAATGRFKSYGGPNPHIDHIHLELNIEASRRTSF